MSHKQETTARIEVTVRDESGRFFTAWHYFKAEHVDDATRLIDNLLLADAEGRAVILRIPMPPSPALAKLDE